MSGITRRALLRWATYALCGAALSACAPLRALLGGLGKQGEVPVSDQVWATFYVAVDGDDRWSGKLPAPNAAKTDGPFATPLRAQQAVRELVRKGLKGNVRVLIRRGRYYLPEPLTFGLQDSGTAEHAITYAAYPGEYAVLIGGVRLTAWTPYQGEIWQASIPEGMQPKQLFENGKRVPLARTPKTGYLEILKPVEGQEQTAFVYLGYKLHPEGWDISDASVVIWPGHNWFSHEKPIVSIDADRYTITLGSDEGYPMTPGNRYFVQNVLALLTQAGECQISRSKGLVYCWPTKAPITEQEMVLSAAEHVIRIQGQSADKPVRNLHFEGLDLSIANGDVISITNAEDCSLRYCLIENGYGSGVAIGGAAQRIILYGNLIRYNGYCGVLIQGPGWKEADTNHHHRIENNHVHHCGELVGHGAGVYISQSGHNQVLHNHIHHMPRYGTTIKGLVYQELRKLFPDLTWEKRFDLLHSRNNLIAYNDIHHVNLDSQDTGAMESWGPGRDNVYDHNLIHDVGNEMFDLQSGMYLDDATDYFTVTNNIIYNVVGTSNNQTVYAKGVGNKFSNNIFIVGPTNSAAISSFFMGEERCDHHEYTRNIFYFEAPGGSIYNFFNWSDDRVAVSDYNLFWQPLGELTVRGAPGGGSLESWRKLLGGKYDQHSLVADPLFMDPANRDYRLQPESPAFKLGFEEIDITQIGLKVDFPERFERE